MTKNQVFKTVDPDYYYRILRNSITLCDVTSFNSRNCKTNNGLTQTWFAC